MVSSAEGAGVVVTGATRGIGYAIALKLAAQGMRLALVARTREHLERVARATGGTAFAADLTSEPAVQRLSNQLTKHFGDVPDVIVNAAGAFALAPIAATSSASFDGLIATNLRAPFLLVRALLPRMLERGSGHIVSIGSVAGRRALPGNGAYSAAKFGLRGFHEVLALELKGSGVRATLIEPAATDTPLWDTIDPARNPDLPRRSDMLEPAAVADCVWFALAAPPPAAIKYVAIERS